MSTDQSSGSSGNHEDGKDSDSASAEEVLLAGYPGAALLVNDKGHVTCSNVKGAGLEALIEHEAAPEIRKMVDQARSKGFVAAESVSLNSAKGEIMLEFVAVPGFAGGGDVLVMAGDMTMERNLRTALVESRQRYKDLVEVSSDFSWKTNVNGEFIFVSPKGALGYKAEELINKKAEEFVISPEEFPPLPFVSTKSLENVEIWMVNKDGSTDCVILSCVPLMSEEEWKGSRGICRNVTEERENESALACSRHREQHLNYIVSTIRDELEPHNMLSAAAAATARALGVTGCRIDRRGKEDTFRIAAEYGNVEGLETLKSKLTVLDSGDKLVDMEIDKW